eukprot:7592491-Karenia_brevis.AAC.1
MDQVATQVSSHPTGARANCDPDAMRMAMMSALQHRWGLSAAKANAQLLLTRLACVGAGASAAYQRREASHIAHLARARASLRRVRGRQLWRLLF